MAPLEFPSPSSDAPSSPFSPSMPPLEPYRYPSHRPRWMDLSNMDRSPTSGLYHIRLTYRGSPAKSVDIVSPEPTDPPHAPFFGRLAPGVCASPPLCSPSSQNHGDACVIGTAQTAVNRYNVPSSRPRRDPVHTAPLVPPAVLPKDELHSDSSCSDLPGPAHTHLFSPLLPNPHETPFASPLALLPLYSEYCPSSSPSLVVDLASLRTPIILEASMTSSNDLEPDDLDEFEPYVELPLTPPRWPMDGRVPTSASSAVQFNSLGLHIGPEVVLPGSDRGDTTPRTGFTSSSLQVSSSLSERLRRLAPAPLFIPNAGSFMSDSGIEISRTPPRGTQIPVTALYFPPAHAPLPEYRLQQAPDGAVAQAEVPGSSTTRFFLSPPRAPEDALRGSNAPSLRSPPPLGRHAPRSLPSMTPSIRSPLGSGRSVTRPELAVFGGQDEGHGLSPLAWTGPPPEEPIDDVGGRALSCVPAVDWIFYSLGCCAFIARDELELLCSSLRHTLTEICRIIRTGPLGIHLLGEAHGPEWEDKYNSVIESLRRHIDYFYLQADQLGKRPPRIHRVATIWQKLWGFVSKFESIERELEAFHEHIRALEIRVRLREMKEAATQELQAERARRTAVKAAAVQSRARRQEMRAEMRRQHELARTVRTRRRLTQVPRLP